MEDITKITIVNGTRTVYTSVFAHNQERLEKYIKRLNQIDGKKIRKLMKK